LSRTAATTAGSSQFRFGVTGLYVVGLKGAVASQPVIAFVPNRTVDVSLSANVARAFTCTVSVKSYLPEAKNE